MALTQEQARNVIAGTLRRAKERARTKAPPPTSSGSPAAQPDGPSQAETPDTSRPSEMLTSSEVESLLQNKREISDFAAKAFAKAK